MIYDFVLCVSIEVLSFSNCCILDGFGLLLVNLFKKYKSDVIRKFSYYFSCTEIFCQVCPLPAIVIYNTALNSNVEILRREEDCSTREKILVAKRENNTSNKQLCPLARTFVSSFLPSFVSSFPSFLPSFLSSFLSSFLLPSFLPSYLPSYLPSFFPSFLPSFLPTFLSSYLPFLLSSYLPSFISSFLFLSSPLLSIPFLSFLCFPFITFIQTLLHLFSKLRDRRCSRLVWFLLFWLPSIKYENGLLLRNSCFVNSETKQTCPFLSVISKRLKL